MALAARRVSKDQLQCNGKGMSLSADYYMELLDLIRANLRMGRHFMFLFSERNFLHAYMYFVYLF